MLFCLDHAHRSPAVDAEMTYKDKGTHPVEYRLTVANQTLHIIFDGTKRWSGYISRPSDGLEASFSSRKCLEHVIEGLLGRRLWSQYRQQVLSLLDQFQV